MFGKSMPTDTASCTPVEKNEGMADLPELSDSLERELALRWRTLLDANGLTGDHLRWHERERERLARVAAQCSIPGGGRHGEDTGEVGIASSVTVAQERFNDLMGEYWRRGCSSGDGYEAFAGWLHSIKRQVTNEIASIWKGGPKRVDSWLKRECAPRVEEALQALVEEAIKRARAEDLKRLEVHTKMSSAAERDALAEGRVAAGKGSRQRRPPAQFPQRAVWLRDQLEERGWSANDLAGYGGPDRKTTERILKGNEVRNDVLKKLRDALAKEMPKDRVLQIPHD